jgi:hypothetical protein
VGGPLGVRALAFHRGRGGYRIGLRQRRASESAEKTTRADARKQAIVQEANAIGTAFLKADFLAESGRGALREGLLGFARTRNVTEAQVKDSASRRVSRRRNSGHRFLISGIAAAQVSQLSSELVGVWLNPDHMASHSILLSCLAAKRLSSSAALPKRSGDRNVNWNALLESSSADD